MLFCLHAFLSSVDFFSENFFSLNIFYSINTYDTMYTKYIHCKCTKDYKNSFRNIIRVSNSLDPNGAQCFVCKVYQQMTLVGKVLNMQWGYNAFNV